MLRWCSQVHNCNISLQPVVSTASYGYITVLINIVTLQCQIVIYCDNSALLGHHNDLFFIVLLLFRHSNALFWDIVFYYSMYYVVSSVSYCVLSALLCYQSALLWLQSAILRCNYALWFLLWHQMLDCAKEYSALPPSALLWFPIIPLHHHHHALLWHQIHLLVTTEPLWFQMFYHLHTVCCSMIPLTFLLKHFTVPLQCHQHSMLGHHKTLLCLQCFIVFYHSILSPLSCPIVTSKYIIKSSQDPILPWQCLMLSVDYCDLTTLLCHQSVLLWHHSALLWHHSP